MHDLGGSDAEVRHGPATRASSRHSMSTNTLLIIIVLVLLFGGGGFFWSRR